MTSTTSQDVFLRRDSNMLIRLNGRVKRALREQATREGLTMTGKIEILILDELRRKGVAVELNESISII